MTVHTIKHLRDQFKAVGKFHTPPELALHLQNLLPNPQPREVYDPTCGAGALLSVFPTHTRKYGQDIDQAALNDANLIPNFTGQLGDVLTAPAFHSKQFEAIVANPPFSVAWNPDPTMFPNAPTIPTKSRADFAFLLHIMNQLAPGGTAVVLQFPGVAYRSGREQKLRKYFTDNGWLHRVEDIPGNTFEDTPIPTIILTLKHQPTQTVEIVSDGKTRTVTVKEIAANDYTWTPNTYIQADEKPATTPVIDTSQVETEIRHLFLNNFDRGLAHSWHVTQIDPTVPPFTSLLQDAQNIINKWAQHAESQQQ